VPDTRWGGGQRHEQRRDDERGDREAPTASAFEGGSDRPAPRTRRRRRAPGTRASGTGAPASSRTHTERGTPRPPAPSHGGEPPLLIDDAGHEPDSPRRQAPASRTSAHAAPVEVQVSRKCATFIRLAVYGRTSSAAACRIGSRCTGSAAPRGASAGRTEESDISSERSKVGRLAHLPRTARRRGPRRRLE